MPGRPRLAFPLIAIGLMSCGRPSADKDSPTSYRMPSAAEVFELRSKCAALGDKILADNFIGSALTQDQVSHYNPRTGRCYVKLEVHTADLSTPREKYIDHVYLYDGQTKEVLALATAEGNRKSGYILDGFEVAKPDHPTGVMATFDDATALIDKYMADDRKQ